MNGYPPRYPDPANRRPGDVPPAIPDPMDDPELRDVAYVVREVLHEHRMRPAARDQLRAQLIAAAAAQVSPPQELRAQRSEPVVEPRPAVDRPGRERVNERPAAARPAGGPSTGRIPVTPSARPPQTGAHRIRPTGRPTPGRPTREPAPSRPAAKRRPTRRVPAIGWSAVGVAAAFAAVVLVVRGVPGVTEQPKVALQQVAAQVMPAGFLGTDSADPADAITMKFSRPLDQATVNDALRITPATAVTKSWKDNSLTVTPAHGFSANSAYVLTIDHYKAKTADGHSLSKDVRVVFGTAPVTPAGPAHGQPAKLTRSELAAAQDGAEAVVTQDGSVLVTAVTAVTAKHGQSTSGLVRMSGRTSVQLASATNAICVSRSGKSVAYLTRNGGQSQVVMADATGATQAHFSVEADADTPIGWINDDEVTFISGGKIRAVNRSGHIRTLAGITVDAKNDTMVLAPGGRYLYVRHGTTAATAGQVIDLSTGQKHELPHALGAAAFSADGSTVVWIESHDNRLDLDSAPSGGGPTLSAHPTDLNPADAVSDLAVSPDGSMLTYTVTHPDKSSQLRLASLPSGTTIAESAGGGGQSPNWAPNARMFTVLAQGSGGPKIQTVEVPKNLTSSTAAMGAIAQAFVNGQISGDLGSQKAISASGLKLPDHTNVSRATVLYVKPTGPGTATATIRLTINPTTNDPVIRQATETLNLQQRQNTGLPEVTGISLTGFRPAPPGPAVNRVDTDTVAGAVLLTFDSDLNPLTVPSGVALVTSSGQEIAATASYDPGTRTVTLQPAASVGIGTGAVTVVLTTSLHDIQMTALAGTTEIPVQLTKTGR